MDIDLEGAEEALGSALSDGDNPSVEAPVEDNPTVESFTGFDPNSLPEDMQRVYKNMQADYTRKTQEIADLRKQYEQFSEYGIDPSAALEAVGFIQRLDSDPAFQQEVMNYLASANEQPNYGQQSVRESTPSNMEGYDNLPPELQQELQAMREFRESFVEAQEHQAMLGELEQEESYLRSQYPHYTDNDMEAIYNLAFATDGDLIAAQELYHGMEQGLLGRYLNAKQVPPGVTSPNGGPVTTPSPAFESLDDAHKAAMEIVRNLQ